MVKMRRESEGDPMDTARRETLTVKELAALIGVSPGTIYRHAANGGIPTVRVPVRRVLFPRERIESLLRGDGDAPTEATHAERRELSAA
jgi:excisionase family DNA binding protein